MWFRRSLGDGAAALSPSALGVLTPAAALPPAHLALAVAVIAIWGTNFAVIDLALEAFGPFTLASLRFLLSALPWIVFVRRPALPCPWLAAYGLLTALQYALLYIALGRDISPGLASVVLQAQVFFTVGIAAVVQCERVRAGQAVAILMATAGLGLIALKAGDAATTLGLALTLGAALSWALANLVSKRVGGADPLGFIIWGSAFAAAPLIVAAVALDGIHGIRQSIQVAAPAAWAAVLWQAFANNLLGFGAWAWLLGRHSAATVTPTALLVPLFGLGAAALALGEAMPAWKLAGAALVIAGLALNLAVASRSAARPA